MYLCSAKVSFLPSVSVLSLIKVSLQVNGVTVEQCSFVNEASANSAYNYEFKNVGLKVAAGEIIKLHIDSEQGTWSMEGYLTCIEEDTGANPIIA
jgi:hypothetical protein